MSNVKILMNGLIKENPTFVLLLGMCPTLATTTSAINGLSMGWLPWQYWFVPTLLFRVSRRLPQIWFASLFSSW